MPRAPKPPKVKAYAPRGDNIRLPLLTVSRETAEGLEALAKRRKTSVSEVRREAYALLLLTEDTGK